MKQNGNYAPAPADAAREHAPATWDNHAQIVGADIVAYAVVVGDRIAPATPGAWSDHHYVTDIVFYGTDHRYVSIVCGRVTFTFDTHGDMSITFYARVSRETTGDVVTVRNEYMEHAPMPRRARRARHAAPTTHVTDRFGYMVRSFATDGPGRHRD